MKIITLILAASMLMTGCASKHNAESDKATSGSDSKKKEQSSKKAGKDKTTEETSDAPTPQPAVDPVKTNAAAQDKDMYTCIAEVSLRVAPAAYSKVSMKIMKGEQVELLEKVSADCWKIRYRDEPGYASPKLLTK